MFRSEDFGQIKFDSKRAMPPPINPMETRPTTASDRLVEFAEERGVVDEAGNPDMSGLHMHQEAFEYVVNQRVVTSEHDEPVIKERDWRWPLSEDPDRSLRNFGRSSRRGGHRIEKTSVVDLDVLDPDKKLLAALHFDSLDQFFDFVNSHEPEEIRVRREKAGPALGHSFPHHLMNQIGNTPLPREPIDLGSIRWGNEASFKPPAEMEAAHRTRINMPRHAGAEPFSDVFRHRDRLELAGEMPGGSWLGLTMMKGTHKFQIVQDNARHSSEPPGMKTDRIFRIREYKISSEDRIVGYVPVSREHATELKREFDYPYTFDALRSFINDGDFTDIYWEVPYTPDRRERDIYRKFGWLATPNFTTPAEEAAEKAMAEEELAVLNKLIDRDTADIEEIELRAVGGSAARKIKLSKERRTAIWLLSGVGAETAEVNHRNMRHIVSGLNKAHIQHQLRALEQITEDQGLAAVINLGLRLQKTFATCAEGLPLPLNTAILNDIGWVMETLANQYNADLRHSIDPKIHSPFGDTPEARHRQHVIGDTHLGVVVATTVIRSKKDIKESLERAGVEDAKEAALDKAKPGDKIEKTVRMVTVQYVDPLFAVSLPDIIKEDALRILSKVTEEDKKLQPGDYQQLGWLLRHAVNTER